MHVQAPGPTQWMYINVILEGSELFVPTVRSPAPKGVQPQTTTASESGILMAWKAMRFGYFWGGRNETILRINADHLSAVGRSSAMSPQQVNNAFSNPLLFWTAILRTFKCPVQMGTSLSDVQSGCPGTIPSHCRGVLAATSKGATQACHQRYRASDRAACSGGLQHSSNDPRTAQQHLSACRSQGRGNLYSSSSQHRMAVSKFVVCPVCSRA